MHPQFQKRAYNFVMGNLTNKLGHVTTQQLTTMLTYVVKNITPHTAQDLLLTETLLRYFSNLHKFATLAEPKLNSSMVLTKDAPPISKTNLFERRDHTLAIWEGFKNSIPLTTTKNPSQSLTVLQEILATGQAITNNGETALYPENTSPLMPGCDNPKQIAALLDSLANRHHIKF